MATGIDFSSAEGYQAYVETFAEDLFTQLFFGFKTAQLATPHEGVKGRHIITELEVASNLATRWSAAFAGTSNLTPTPTILEVVTNKVEHSVIPQNFESNYLGILRRKGQSSDDYPFQAYMLDKLMRKLNSELEVAAWQGVAAGSPASTDLLRETFDGYLQIIADAITATTLTPVATGAITSSNAVAKFREMWAAVDTAYKDGGVDIFCSYSTYDNYRINYKDTYKVDPAFIQVTDAGYQGVQYELAGGNAQIIPIAGMGTSGRVVITPRENLHYGYDDLSDWMNFQFEKDHRQLDFWMDFNMGVAITMMRDGIITVNDQT